MTKNYINVDVANKCEDVFAVIVTFNPDICALEELLNSLLPQVGGAIIVDNCSDVNLLAWHKNFGFENLTIKELSSNHGIAYAQNIGIGEANRMSTKFILLSDQDSKPARDMVYCLKKAAIKLAASGKKVAAVGPRFTDARQNNPSPFTEIKGLTVRRQCESTLIDVVETDHLIASGCLIPMQVIDVVGLMNEDMFIDYVDIEWSLRAKNFGFQSFGVFSAAMNHHLGDDHVDFFGKRVTLHSPLRHYYMMRNGIWMYKQKHIPAAWKLVDAYRLILRACFYVIFAKPRHKHFLMIVHGIFHGLRSRMGKY